MISKIRIYFSNKIHSDLIAPLTKDQSHYIKDVMRLKLGDNLSVFNTQGEWNATIEKYEKEGHPYYASARLWDDGVINPLDTRLVVGKALRSVRNTPIPDHQFPVFRM